MFYLTEKTDVMPGNDETEDCTRLEFAMRAFERLIRLEGFRSQVNERDVNRMRIILKEQSIMAFLKRGDCKKALAVCKRQYKYCADISVKKSLEHISNALCLRNTKPNDWSLFSKNSDLIYLAKDVIRKVFGVMSTPLLLKMAIKSMEKRSYEAFQEEMDFSINYSLPSVVIPLYQMSLFKPKSINFLPKPPLFTFQITPTLTSP